MSRQHSTQMSIRGIFVALIVAPLAACSGAPPAPAASVDVPPLKPVAKAATADAPVAKPGEKNVLHVHGSNTLGFSVMPRLTKAFLEKQGAGEVFVNDESRAKDRVWVQARLQGGETSIEIFAPGTKVGFESLGKGYADLVLASRPITGDEESKLQPSETVVAMDGIAVVVHPSNPVSKLTMKQLADVFSGKVTSWSGVAGKQAPIHVFSRDEKSGTHDGFVSLVMGGKEPKAEKTFDDSEALVAAVAKDENAIGFVGLPYVKSTKPLAIQDGGAAVLPTPFAIATEDYPLSRRLFFYTPSAPKNPMTKELVEFALSDEGQALVADSGFVPLSLRAETLQVPNGAPAGYAKLANGATRLSVSFRFKKGTASLDAKAKRDLDRLMSHLNSPINRGRHIALAGFADSTADSDKVAKQGLDVVAAQLVKRGVQPDEVASFGSAMPLASNDSPDGRSKNRRVEVWLR